MDQSEKLLMGIENILSVASDLIDEVARLKNIEEECRILKEKIFMNQLTKAEQEVFAFIVDGHSISEIQHILCKEESTIKKQRRSILQKLKVSSMEEAVLKFKMLDEKSIRILTKIS